jgi:hypothetical protein
MGKIGKGAFGSAHLLVHKDTSKYFVIKKIRLAKQTGAARPIQHSHAQSGYGHLTQLSLCSPLAGWQRSSALQERDMVSTAHPRHTLVQYHDSSNN